MKLHSWPVYFSFPFGFHLGHLPNLSIPLPSQITISVLPPIYLDSYSADDAEDKAVLEEISKKVIAVMQKEMDQLAKGRIPVLGKIPRKYRL